MKFRAFSIDGRLQVTSGCIWYCKWMYKLMILLINYSNPECHLLD